MARPPIVDWQKVQRIKEAVTPDLYKGTPYQIDPKPRDQPQPEIQLQGVPPAAKPTPEKPAAEQAPRRAPGGPGPSKNRKAPPGPTPAQIASTNGVPPVPPAADVPRETPAASAPNEGGEPEKDRHAFSYLADVEAMEAELMARGRVAEAADVRSRYNQLIDGQFKSMEIDYRTKTLPQVQAIQSQLLEFEGKQVPQELVMKARDTVQQAAQQQEIMLGYLYGLVRNDATKGLGIQYFNQSDLIEPGVQLAELVVKDGMLIGVDQGGQPVKLSSGQDFMFPIEAAEQLYAKLFEAERDQHVIVPEGAMLVNNRSGRVTAHNPKDTRGTPSEQMTAVKYVRDSISNALGIDLTDTGRMMEGVDQATRDEAMRLTAVAGQLVREGMDPEIAVQEALKQRRSAPEAATAPSRYSGPLPWRP